MWNKGVPLENKGVARLLLRENKRACPTYQVCIERESIPTVTDVVNFVDEVSLFLFDVFPPKSSHDTLLDG